MEKKILYGWIASGAWVAVALGYAAWIVEPCITSDATCEAVTLGEFGDFASGVAAPLAFLWFVIAVFLQHDELSLQRLELQQTREILRLQNLELSRQSEEMQGASDFRRVQLESDERQAQPVIMIHPPSKSSGRCLSRASNEGATVTNMEIRDRTPDLNIGFRSPVVMQHGESRVMSLDWMDRDGDQEFTLVYEDAGGQRRWLKFRYASDRKRWSKSDEGQDENGGAVHEA